MGRKVLENSTARSDSERAILSLLTLSNSPLSSGILSILSGMPIYKVCRILGRLEKFSIVERATVTPTVYWKLKPSA